MASGDHQADTYIQQWLSQTTEHQAPRATASVSLPADAEDHRGRRHFSVHVNPGQTEARGHKKSIGSNNPISHCAARGGREKEPSPSSHIRRGIPERLGLQAAFRTRAENEPPTGRDRYRSREHRTKRKRNSSSDSSFLEADTGRSSRALPAIDNHRARRVLADKRSLSKDDSTTDASVSTVGSEDVDKRYRRKQRHKTRADLYDPTSTERTESRPKKLKESKRVKKQKSKKKPAPLLHDFSAKNVSGDRLTLKPPVNIGLFKNGRASSPVRGRGLPDLTFSEMRFLEKRKDIPEDEKPSKRTGGKRERVPAGQEEISSYFTSAHKVLTERNPNVSKSPARRTSTAKEISHTIHGRDNLEPLSNYTTASSNKQSRIIPLDGFLGGGTRGARYDAPLEKPQTPSAIGFSESAKCNGSGRSLKSTTYFTWSRSGPPPETPDDTSPTYGVERSKPKNACHYISSLCTIEVGQLGHSKDLKSPQGPSLLEVPQETPTSTSPPRSRPQVEDHTYGDYGKKRKKMVEPIQEDSTNPESPHNVSRDTKIPNWDMPVSTKPTTEQSPKASYVHSHYNEPSKPQLQGRSMVSITDLLKECESTFVEPHILPSNALFPTVLHNRQDTDTKPVLNLPERREVAGNANPCQGTDYSRSKRPLTYNVDTETTIEKCSQCTSGTAAGKTDHEYGSRGLFGSCRGLANNIMPSDHIPQLQINANNVNFRKSSSRPENDGLTYGPYDGQPELLAQKETWPQPELHMRTVEQLEPPFDSTNPEDCRLSDWRPANEDWILSKEECGFLNQAVEEYDGTDFLDSACPKLDLALTYSHSEGPLYRDNEYTYRDNINPGFEHDTWVRLGGRSAPIRDDHHSVFDDDYLKDSFIYAEHGLNRVHSSDFNNTHHMEYQHQFTDSPSTCVPSFWRPHKLY
ncbi:MAG: hypothetical protein M1812_003165 [Candelaria pacifica]|nr:MAG: hypothetical protein M1812_003165 [Candelaria pacifica]